MDSLTGLLNRPALYRALHRFNFLPSLDLHPSWHSALFPSAFPLDTLSCPSAHPHISRYLLANLGLSDALCLDLSEPLLGLASLPRERLAKLAVLLGLLAIASPLRRLLDRQQVEQYRRVLGEEAWQFVRQRSSFLISGVPLIEDLPEPHILLDHSSTVGYCWLYPVLAETPRALFVRASLKMPAAIESSWQQASPPPNLATVLRVYREAEPDWQRLFAGAG